MTACGVLGAVAGIYPALILNMIKNHHTKKHISNAYSGFTVSVSKLELDVSFSNLASLNKKN